MLGERPGVSAPDKIWKELFQVIGKSGGRKLGACYKGDAPQGHTTYFAGTEASVGLPENVGLTTWQLPAREYVVCGFEAENFEALTVSALGKAMKYTRFWLKKHGLIADGFFPEMYYPSSPEMPYMELWIPFKCRENMKAEGI